MPTFPDDWGSVRALRVNANNNEALTDYQVKVSLQGSDSGSPGYISDWSGMEADGADLRVTADDGTTLYDFWLADFDKTAKTATLVVEVPSISAPNGDFYLMVWYEASGASSVSSYDDTMSLREVVSTDDALWHLDDGSGTTASDETDASNDLTLDDASMWQSGDAPTGNPLAGDIDSSPNADQDFSTGAHIATAYDSYGLDGQTTYYATNGTLLDTVPASGRIEFIFVPDNNFGVGSTNYRLVYKIGDSDANNRLDINMSGSDGKLKAVKVNGGSGVILASSQTSWTAGTAYNVVVEWGPDSTNGRFEMWVDGTSVDSDSDTNAWASGTLRDFIVCAANYGGTLSNWADATLFALRVTDLTTPALLAQYHFIEGTGTTTADTSGNGYTLTLSGASMWPGSTSLMPYGIVRNADVLSEPGTNMELSLWFTPQQDIDSSLASTSFLVDRYLNYHEVLDVADDDYGHVSGLLDTFPDEGWIECTFRPASTFDSSKGTNWYIFEKSNVEGGSPDRLELYLDETNGKLTYSITTAGVTNTITSTATSWPPAYYLIRVYFGDTGMALYVDGVAVAANVTYTDVPGTGSARDFAYGASLNGGTAGEKFSGRLGPLRIADESWANGRKKSVSSITHSGTTATVTTGSAHNYPDGAEVVQSGATGADGAYYNGTFTITVTGSTTYTYTMSGTPSASASGTLIARRGQNTVMIAEYRLADSTSGTTLTDETGDYDMTLTSTSAWSSAKYTIDAFNSAFIGSSGVLRWTITRGLQSFSIDSALDTWDAGTWYYVRFAAGIEGMSIYVDEDRDTNGAFEVSYKLTPGGAGAADDFAIGGLLRQGRTTLQTPVKIDEVAASNVHTSNLRARAHYQRRKIVSDPFTRVGPVLSYHDVDTSGWSSPFTDAVLMINEPTVLYDSGTLRALIGVIPDYTGSNSGIAYFTSDSQPALGVGEVWADAAGDVVFGGYQHPTLVTDETGTVIMPDGTNYWAYAVDNATKQHVHRFTATSLGGTWTDQGSVFDVEPEYTGISISGDGATATATISGHSYVTGNHIIVDNGSGGYFDSPDNTSYTVTGVSGNDVSFAHAYSGSDTGCRVGGWDSYLFGNVFVWKEGSTYYMNYEGRSRAGLAGSWQEGLATSSDGDSWTAASQNYVFNGPNGQASDMFTAKMSDDTYRHVFHERYTGFWQGYSSDAQTITVDTDRSPLVQTTQAQERQGIGDAWLVEAGNDTLLLANTSPWEVGTQIQVDMLLWRATNKTIEQALLPEPTITTVINIYTNTDSITATEYSAQISLNQTINTSTDAITVAEYPATITTTQDVEVLANTDAITVTENAADVNLDKYVNASTDTLTILEQNADVNLDKNISATTDSIIISELAATINLTHNVDTSLDTIIISEFPATITLPHNVEANTDAIIVTEYTAVIGNEVIVNTTTDILTITEFQASVTLDRNVSASVDSIIVAEQPATVTLPRNVTTSTDSIIATTFAADIGTGGIDVNCTLDIINVTEYPALIIASSIHIDGETSYVLDTDYETVTLYNHNGEYYSI